MRLSSLQKFILKEGYLKAKKVKKKEFFRFYNNVSKKPKPKNRQNIITKSLERLINKEYLVAEGKKTPHKLFIDTVRLTLKGKRIAKKLLGEQKALPFRFGKKDKK